MALFKSGAVGPFNTGLPQPIGFADVIPFTEIAPEVDIARPSKFTSVFIIIAALFTITVPFIVVPVAIFTKPSTFQKTLQALAPFSNLTSEKAVVENAPLILKMKTALGLF